MEWEIESCNLKFQYEFPALHFFAGCCSLPQFEYSYLSGGIGGVVWFGSVGYHNSFIFRVHLSHLMNVRHGILNFNCCNAAIALLLLLLFAVPNGVYVQNSKCTAFGMPTEIGWNCVSVYSASNDERERARISLPFSESIYVILCMCARVAAAATAAELYGPCLVCTSSIHAQYLLKFYIYIVWHRRFYWLYLDGHSVICMFRCGYLHRTLFLRMLHLPVSLLFSLYHPLIFHHSPFFFCFGSSNEQDEKKRWCEQSDQFIWNNFFPHFIFSPIPFFNT